VGQDSFDASGVSAQQALYKVPQSDFNDVTSGALPATSHDVGTGLGSPVANLLIPALIAFPGAVNAPASAPTSQGLRLEGGTTPVAARLDGAPQQTPTVVAVPAATQLPDVALSSPQAGVNIFVTGGVGAPVQIGLNSGLATNGNNVFVAPVNVQPGRDSGFVGSSWASLMDEIGDTLLLGFTDPRSVLGTLGAVRSVPSAADEVFGSPDLQQGNLMSVPAAAPASTCPTCGTDRSGSGSDLWMDWVGSDGSDEG